MRTLILGWLEVAAIGWANRKSSRAKVPNAVATLVLPVDGISDGFLAARSGFQHDQDGRLLLKAEHRDPRGLPGNILFRILHEALQFLHRLPIKSPHPIPATKSALACIPSF